MAGIGHGGECTSHAVIGVTNVVFIESAVPPKVVESLIEPCRARNHEVVLGGELYADALGDAASGADTYVGMMRSNVDTIVAALSGGGSE